MKIALTSTMTYGKTPQSKEARIIYKYELWIHDENKKANITLTPQEAKQLIKRLELEYDMESNTFK